MSSRSFVCKFCGAGFVTESRYLKHTCTQMIRDEQFKTAIGNMAWIYYQNWMKSYRRVVPKSSVFLKSRFYNSFIKFAEFVKKYKLPDTNIFIRMMKDKDICPTLWTNDKVYAMYLEHVDRVATPHQQADITINTLFDVAQEHDCDVGNVFDFIRPTEVIQLLRQRRISPWILLNSNKFKQFYVNSSTEERIIMESIIRPPYWKTKFNTNTTHVERMKCYVNELSL